ncbi:12465_t:CDS:2 [Funneliformis caledonium]|uniref:12465_t:CDS:1 n=1 Tax=Funneliformis caledonium TaxID=1117310 RepID=A0A9N9FQI2_9GLOM|nr:12465_t:CDS:2 [Funneliformis caledonium]
MDNLDKDNSNTDTPANLESIPNISLLLQLLANLTALQQAAIMITKQNQQTSSALTQSTNSATSISSMPSNALISVINTSFKSDFPTFPVSVGDFVLQKITEDIVGNWAETERKKIIKEAQIKSIDPPPKRKNIIPPNSKFKKMKTIPPAPNTDADLPPVLISNSTSSTNADLIPMPISNELLTIDANLQLASAMESQESETTNLNVALNASQLQEEVVKNSGKFNDWHLLIFMKLIYNTLFIQ